MHLEHLSLVDFRSYPAADLDLGPGVTVLLGGNGNGKTNLLEAVGYLAALASHRVAADAPLVRQGADAAVIRARVRRGDRVATTDIEITPGSGLRVQVNRHPVARPRRSPPLLRAVVFAPEDLAVVRGEPDRRRRLLDDLATVRAPRLAGVRSDYERVLRQRAALLRSLRAAAPGARAAAAAALDVWDSHLADTGADLVVGRCQALAALTPHAVAAYDEVSGGAGPLDLRYEARGLSAPGGEVDLGPDGTHHLLVESGSAEVRERVREALASAAAARRRDEVERGACLVGPHRDELELRVRGLPARGYASHGEAWSLALALRLGTFDLLSAEDEPGAQPVLVLDDVFAELDGARRRHLADRAARAEQALVSAAVAEDVPNPSRGRVVSVVRDPGTGLSRLVAG
ncbi:MAG: DNA replication/repair protein RecF [Kineosporiaceae bacterium]